MLSYWLRRASRWSALAAWARVWSREVHGKKQKRIFKALRGLFLRCGCEGGGSARSSCVSRAAHIGSNETPTRLSCGDGCIRAVPASVSPGLVVPLTPLERIISSARRRTGSEGGCVPVPVPLRLWSVRQGNAQPTISATRDLPGGCQTRECLADALVAHADGRAE